MALALATGSKNSIVGSTTVTSTAIASNAAGSGFVVVITFDRAATLTNLTSNKETLTLSSWTLVDAVQDNSGGGFKTAMYLLPKGVGGSGHTFTATISASNTLTILVGQVTTTNGNGFLYDVGDSEIDGTSPFTNGPLSNTKIPGLMLSCMGGASGSNPATHAESTGYTILTGADETNGASFWTSAIASKAVAATGSQVASWTETGGTTAIVDTASIYEAPGGSVPRRPTAPVGKHPGPRLFGPIARGYPTVSNTDVTVALTGSSVVFSAGTLAPSTAAALTGSQYTWAAGTLSPSTTVTLSGQAYVWSAGTVTPSSSLALAGSLETYSAGTLTPSTTVGLTGTQYTWSTGTITATTGGDVTVALSGTLISFSAGTLTPSTSVALTGTAESYSAGTLAVNHAQPLTGIAEAYSSGVLTPSTTIAMNGSLVAFSTGTLTAQAGGDVTVALTGTQMTFFAGQMIAQGGDAAQSASGGYYYDLEAIRHRRLLRQRMERERKEDEREIQDALDRQIAQSLYEQEQKDSQRADLVRLQSLADSLMKQKELPRQLLAVTMKAHEERTANSLLQLEREISQMLDFEEAAISALLLLDD